MCTTSRCVISAASCFMQEQDSGERAYGCCYYLIGELCFTKNKVISVDEETDPFNVVIPPVEELGCRSALICVYCGFSCNPLYSPVGVSTELTSCCYRGSWGANIVTGESDKRACDAINCVHSCLSCEDTVNDDSTFVVCDEALKGMACCCVEQGATCNISFCPKPMVCLGSQLHCCCCYGKSGIPCNDQVPCEIGLCGVLCVNKTDLIAEAEGRIREKKAENAPVEAVIVTTKGGAPTQVMVR